MIQNNVKIKKLNGQEKYFKFFYQFCKQLSFSFFIQTQNMNHQKQALKKMNFLFKACKSVFYESFNAVSISTKICNGTADAMNIRVVKITLVIEAIVTFVELSISIALMTLKKLNTIYNHYIITIITILWEF